MAIAPLQEVISEPTHRAGCSAHGSSQSQDNSSISLIKFTLATYIVIARKYIQTSSMAYYIIMDTALSNGAANNIIVLYTQLITLDNSVVIVVFPYLATIG
jgi:hypothetical protein